MSKFTTVWNSSYESLPGDTEQESVGASRIRDGKLQTRVRLQQDHSWNGDDSDGYHSQVTLLATAAPPAPPTPAGGTAGSLFSNLVNNIEELFWRTAAGLSVQLTSAGVVNAGAEISGVIKLFAGSVAPAGYAFCNGQQFLVSAQPNLFAAIGYLYGGSGPSFNAPDIRGRTVFGLDPGNATGRMTNFTDQGTGLSAASLGNAGGESGHTQNATELANHVHGVNDPGHFHAYTAPTVGSSGGTFQNGGGNFNSGFASSTGTSFTNISIAAAGGGAPFNVTNPGIVLNYIIKL